MFENMFECTMANKHDTTFEREKKYYFDNEVENASFCHW